MIEALYIGILTPLIVGLIFWLARVALPWLWNRSIEFLSCPLKLMNGQKDILQELQIIKRDVDEIRREQRMVSTRLSSHLSMNGDSGEFQARPDGHITWASSEARELFAGEVMGMEWLNCIHNDDRELILEKWQNAAKLKIKIITQFETVNGEKRFLNAAPVIHDDVIESYVGWISNDKPSCGQKMVLIKNISKDRVR